MGSKEFEERELERECLDIYQRKVDEASNAKARLNQSIAAKEAELAALMVALGEHNLDTRIQTKNRLTSLKEQLASVMPLVEDMRMKKEECIKQFTYMKAHIEKISGEISDITRSDQGLRVRIIVIGFALQYHVPNVLYLAIVASFLYCLAIKYTLSKAS